MAPLRKSEDKLVRLLPSRLLASDMGSADVGRDSTVAALGLLGGSTGGGSRAEEEVDAVCEVGSTNGLGG